MNRMFVGLTLGAAAATMAVGDLFAKVQTWGDEKYRPRLFKNFGDIVNVPDGLTKDPQGNIYHSAPNLVKKDYPGVIVKRDFKSGRWSVLCAGLRSPKTGYGRPMGLEFCEEDGNLYYCDNQYFDSKDYASRVMRVVLNKKGEALRIETAVDNVKLANAIRFYKGDMFITDTYFDLGRKDGIGMGGVYRIPLAACKDKTVSLLPKTDYKKDPYFLCATETKPLERKDDSGADGLAITKEGHLYFGTFGSLRGSQALPVLRRYLLRRGREPHHHERQLPQRPPHVGHRQGGQGRVRLRRTLAQLRRHRRARPPRPALRADDLEGQARQAQTHRRELRHDLPRSREQEERQVPHAFRHQPGIVLNQAPTKRRTANEENHPCSLRGGVRRHGGGAETASLVRTRRQTDFR